MPETGDYETQANPSDPGNQDVSSIEYFEPSSADDLEKFPPSMSRMMFSAYYSGQLANPLLDKLTTEHIAALIDSAERRDDRELEDRKHSRKWRTIILALLVIPSGGLLAYFAFLEQNALVAEVIKLAAVGLGGFGGGYGFARWRHSQHGQ